MLHWSLLADVLTAILCNTDYKLQTYTRHSSNHHLQSDVLTVGLRSTAIECDRSKMILVCPLKQV